MASEPFDYGPVTSGPIGRALCRLGFHRDRGGLGLSWCSRCHKEWPAPPKRRRVLADALEAIDAGDYERADRIFEAATGDKPLRFKITRLPNLNDVLDDDSGDDGR